jgi:high frequency lysogenization protein
MATIKTPENQTLALAGIFQSVHLCKSLATSGTCDQDELRGTLRSILTLNSERVIDAYGGNTRTIKRGLRCLRDQFAGNTETRDMDIARYSLSLIQLGTNVQNDDRTVEQLRIGISQMQSEDGDLADPELIENLANLYRSSISNLTPRIMISGDPGFLNDAEIAATIRAALLGGIRSVVLWRQCGGTRLKLIMQRAQHARLADGYLLN